MADDYTKYIKKISYEDEFNDLFECPHTCIENTRKVVDCGFPVELLMSITMENTGTIFYEDSSCFDSIYELGKLLKKDEQKLKGDTRLLEEVEHISKWLECNAFPYRNSYIFPNFVYDCVQLYSIFEAHKWLIKTRRNIKVIANSFSKTKTDNPELINLIDHLDYLKNNTINFGEKINHILNSPKYESYKELLSQSIIDFKENKKK